MKFFDVIYQRCEELGNAIGFGAFEGGVIYFAIFSLLIIALVDSIHKCIVKKKDNKKEVVKDDNKDDTDDMTFKLKIIK